jgi:FkbH-like protein
MAGSLDQLKQLLASKQPEFFELLRRHTVAAEDFSQMVALSTLRRRAAQQGFAPARRPHALRLAMIGGCSLYPLQELVGHCLESAGYPEGQKVELFTGAYDNYVAEMMQPDSKLFAFRPDVIFLIPSPLRCAYSGDLFDLRSRQAAEACQIAAGILDLCRIAHDRTGAEIVLANFLPASGFDPGPYRTRTAASDWSFRKLVNLELGFTAPPFVQICDVEFLAARFGSVRAHDPRAWFESKQLYAADFMVHVAHEVNHIVSGLRRGTKKVVALDLDNTLWGGVIGDDGLEGIEIGDTSPRGEAFKAFQHYLKSLTHRGVLLTVCSKNDEGKALEPFEKHPEMVLRRSDFVSFKANWEPKSENLRHMAKELNLGLDSFVFVDDNPAEIEIVRQFVPEVETVHLGTDPSAFIELLTSRRFFEPLTITSEDLDRVNQYQSETRRKELESSCTDMAAYLRSLLMTAVIAEFQSVDVPRIAQLINKSNQFNLTTRRRTESEVRSVMNDPACACFTVRLADRFGDHGLISVVVCRAHAGVMEVDTWLMSCRVLKRQVEEEVLNEIVRLARERDCFLIRGRYIPTAKNDMVRDLYPRMGFSPAGQEGQDLLFELIPGSREPFPTAIEVNRRAHEQVVSA